MCIRDRITERDGELVAYGAAIDTGIARHLADLFVRPDLLGRGIGLPLLAAVMGDAPQRTTFASADPRALPLYVRAGIAPLWSSLSLGGTAAALPAPGLSVRIEPADPARLASLERAWTGCDRSTDHLFWASQAEAEGFVVLDAGEPAAFGYARARQVGVARALDRLLVRPDGEPVGPRSRRSGTQDAAVRSSRTLRARARSCQRSSRRGSGSGTATSSWPR